MNNEDIQEEVDSLIAHRDLGIGTLDDERIRERSAEINNELDGINFYINEFVFLQCQELIGEE
jgi:hypothetical protein